MQPQIEPSSLRVIKISIKTSKIELSFKKQPSEGRFSKLGLDLELDDDFQVDVGVELDDLALPEEVQLVFLH